MVRYIDVGGIKKHIIRDGNLIGERNYITFSELDEIPTADVRENVKGEWIKGGEQPYFRKHFDIVVCSKCNKRGEHRWNFCPNCGADMRGEQE